MVKMHKGVEQANIFYCRNLCYSTTITCQLLLSNPQYESVVQKPFGAISSKYIRLDYLTQKGTSLAQL